MNIAYLLQENKKLQVAMGNPMVQPGHAQPDHAVKENMLALIVEATEVLDEISWKPWKPVATPTNREAVLLELIDVLQFWANAVNELGFTPDEIKFAYDRKLIICYQRIFKQNDIERLAADAAAPVESEGGDL